MEILGLVQQRSQASIHHSVLVSCYLAFSFDQASLDLLPDKKLSAMANTKWLKSSSPY